MRARLGEQWYNDLLVGLVHEYGDRAAFDEDDPDVAVVDNQWWVTRRRERGDAAMRELASQLTGGGQIPLVGIDHCDVPLPKFTPADVDNFALVLKGQGLPRDRDLINWKIGVRYGLNRCRKIERVDDDLRLRPEQIAKFALSFDLGFYHFATCPLSPPSDPRDGWDDAHDAFFVGSFNSLNRLHVARVIRNQFRGFARLVAVDEHHPIVGVPATELAAAHASARQAEPDLFSATVEAAEFARLLHGSKTVPAPSGIGELGLRHYQALAACRTLICEDLDYIETVYPFARDRNYVAMADDASDFADVLRGLVGDPDRATAIAVAGMRDYVAAYSDTDALFDRLFLQPIAAVL